MVRERDNSEISTFLMCPRAHDYAYHRLLRPVHERLNLTAGTIGHAAAACIMQGQPWRELVDGWRDEMGKALEVGSDGPDPSYGADELTQKHSDLVHGMDAYEGWWGRQQNIAVLGLEEPFAWKVPGTMTTMIGKVDAIIQVSGQTWLHELKTSARRWSASETAINRQFASYTCAMRSRYPDLVGVRLVNVLLKTPSVTICKPTKARPQGFPSSAQTVACDRDTYEQALKQCNILSTDEDFAEVLARLPGRIDYHIQEDPSSFTTDALANFITEDLRDVIRLMDRAKNERHRVRSPGLFSLNCQSCAYTRICGAELHGWDVSDLGALGYTVGSDKFPYLRDDVKEAD